MQEQEPLSHFWHLQINWCLTRSLSYYLKSNIKNTFRIIFLKKANYAIALGFHQIINSIRPRHLKWLTMFLVLDAMGHGEMFKHVQGFFQVQRPDDASSSTSSDVQVVILI